MARTISLNRVASFERDPHVALPKLEDNIARKLLADDQAEFGPLNRTQVQTSVYTARPWDIVIADPSAGAFSVVLPDPTAALAIGSWIGVKHNSDSTNAVGVVPLTGTIDGAASSSVRQPRGYKWYWSDGTEWKHGPSRNEFGAPRVLDTKYNPVGLWNMQLGAGIGIKDYSGNGNDMSVETGTLRYSALHPLLGGVLFDGGSNAYVNASPAVLQVTGALTILALCMWSDLPTGTNVRTIMSHGATGATADLNYLYRFAVDLNNQCQYFSQHGVKVNDVLVNNTFSPRSQVALLGLTRSSGGVLNFWYNGTTVGGSFGTTTLPANGVNGKARIGGGSSGGAEFFTGVISSVGIYAAELTAVQMLERYNYTLGPAYGYR